MNNIMVDIETLGTTADSVVLSIGACFFGTEMGPHFNMNLKFDDQLKTRSVNADTLKWWVGQTQDARRIFSGESLPTIVVLTTFVKWVEANADVSKVKVWGNGSSFDISILEHLLLEYNLKVPWRYNNVRDLRTFKEYVAEDAPIMNAGVKHDALDDAIAQANYVMENTK